MTEPAVPAVPASRVGLPANIAGRRVLVTGGSGFIGRHVIAMLVRQGASVRVVDLQPHADQRIDVVQGDIADPQVLERAFDGGFDAVVHLAAVTSVLRSIEQPELTFRTNVLGTHNLLEAARRAGVSALAFASTNAVTGPMQDPAITERSRLRPMTPYGSTKAAGEMLMSAYTAVLGVRCVALRLTNVYGLGMQAKDSIVARLMRAVRDGAEFNVYGDGTQVRDYVNAADVAEAFGLALMREDWQGPVVIGSGRSLSVLEVVQAVREVTGAVLEVGHVAAKEGEMPAVVVDPARARSAGWTPRFTFHAGLEAVWQEWAASTGSGPSLIVGSAT